MQKIFPPTEKAAQMPVKNKTLYIFFKNIILINGVIIEYI
jgi:hypothetical protein